MCYLSVSVVVDAVDVADDKVVVVVVGVETVVVVVDASDSLKPTNACFKKMKSSKKLLKINRQHCL